MTPCEHVLLKNQISEKVTKVTREKGQSALIAAMSMAAPAMWGPQTEAGPKIRETGISEVPSSQNKTGTGGLQQEECDPKEGVECSHIPADGPQPARRKESSPQKLTN